MYNHIFEMTTDDKIRRVIARYPFWKNPVKQRVFNFCTDYFAAKDYDTGKVHKTMNTISIHQYNASWKTPKQKLVYKIKMVIGEKNFEKLLEVKKRIK